MTSISPSNVTYLLALQRLGAESHPVRTGDIAADLKVSAPSVVVALRRLQRDHFVAVSPWAGTKFTPKGAEVAQSLFRRHALVEVLVHRVLKVSWEHVHEEAARLQATISPRLESAMAELFADTPETPYGHRIPSSDGQSLNRDLVRLNEVQENRTMIVREVDDFDAERLCEFSQAGLIPGSTVHIESRLPNGSLRIRVNNKEVLIDHHAAFGVRGELMDHHAILNFCLV